MKCYGKINLRGTNLDMSDKEYMVLVDYLEVLYKGKKLKLNISNITSIYRSNKVIFGNADLFYTDNKNNKISVSKEIIENCTLSNISVKVFDQEDEKFFTCILDNIDVSIYYLNFIYENKEIYIKNSLLPYYKPAVLDNTSGSKLLDLQKVIEFPGNANNTVLLLSGGKILNDDNKEVAFGDYYGELCGGSNQGLLLEESAEMLFIISGIDIKAINYNDMYVILSQNGIDYIIDLVIGTEGCSEPSDHIDFNTLEVYHTDRLLISMKQNKKFHIKYIDDVYNADSDKLKMDLMYSEINDIMSISKYDDNILLAPTMVHDLATHILNNGYECIPPIIEIESCFVNKEYRNQGLFTDAMNYIIDSYDDAIILTSAYADTREYLEVPKDYDSILIPLSEMLQRKFNLKDINGYVKQEYSIVLALGTGEKSKKIIDDILEKINKI